MKLQKPKIYLLPIVIGSIFIGLMIGCPIHYFTGLYCPGCGITRMFLALVKLDIYQAFRYNPLVFIYLCFFLLYYIYHRYYPENIISKKIVYGLIVVALIFGLMRNISLFSYLQPTVIK